MDPQPRRFVLPSYAKINLSLEVLNKRADGFHNIRTIFHTIDLADTITIDYQPHASIELSISGSVDIPDNLILRAARAAMEFLGEGARVHFHLEKRIPMGAGLGGGSSNAGVVLLAIARLADIDPLELSKVAASIGSDVPFFLHGGCALGLGRGTELYPLPDAANLPLLLLTPGIHVSTPEAYKALQRDAVYQPEDEHKLARFAYALGSGNEWKMGVNDFEKPVFAIYPELANAKRALEQAGASHVSMSGSGSSIFAVFPTELDREEAHARLPQLTLVPVRCLSRACYKAALQMD